MLLSCSIHNISKEKWLIFQIFKFSIFNLYTPNIQRSNQESLQDHYFFYQRERDGVEVPFILLAPPSIYWRWDGSSQFQISDLTGIRRRITWDTEMDNFAAPQLDSHRERKRPCIFVSSIFYIFNILWQQRQPGPAWVLSSTISETHAAVK